MSWLKITMTSDQYRDNKSGAASATRKFYVESDTVLTPDQAMSADDGTTAIPLRGGGYSALRSWVAVVDRTSDKISPKQYEITVQYEGPAIDLEVDLLSLPAKISTRDEQIMEEYTVDTEGSIVMNTAGEPFDSVPQRLAGITVYTVQKFVNAAIMAAINAAKRTVNESDKMIKAFLHDERTLLLADCWFDPIEGTNVEQATITIKHKIDGWDDKIMNFGFSQKWTSGIGGYPDTRKVMTEIDEQGLESQITKPWPLNADGTRMEEPVPHGATPLVVLEFKPYAAHDWAGVPLT